jgi:hypothetical protein
MKHFLQLLSWVVIISAGCATTVNPLPPNDSLQAAILEVGRAMGMTKVYENRPESLFVWRFKVSSAEIAQSGDECEGLFAWHVKAVGSDIALYDPIAFLPGCSLTPEKAATVGSHRQEEFKARWRSLVGPVSFLPPSAKTHSTSITAEVMGQLIKEATSHHPGVELKKE